MPGYRLETFIPPEALSDGPTLGAAAFDACDLRRCLGERSALGHGLAW